MRLCADTGFGLISSLGIKKESPGTSRAAVLGERQTPSGGAAAVTPLRDALLLLLSSQLTGGCLQDGVLGPHVHMQTQEREEAVTEKDPSEAGARSRERWGVWSQERWGVWSRERWGGCTELVKVGCITEKRSWLNQDCFYYTCPSICGQNQWWALGGQRR